jgi:hypothetical protein
MVAEICGACTVLFVPIVGLVVTVLTSVHGKPVNYGQTIQLRHVRYVATAPADVVKSHPQVSLLLAGVLLPE